MTATQNLLTFAAVKIAVKQNNFQKTKMLDCGYVSYAQNHMQLSELVVYHCLPELLSFTWLRKRVIRNPTLNVRGKVMSIGQAFTPNHRHILTFHLLYLCTTDITKKLGNMIITVVIL